MRENGFPQYALAVQSIVKLDLEGDEDYRPKNIIYSGSLPPPAPRGARDKINVYESVGWKYRYFTNE